MSNIKFEIKLGFGIMGCTQSQILEHKGKGRATFNVVQNTSFIQGEDLYLMGQLSQGKYIFSSITTSRIASCLINPNSKPAVNFNELPKVLEENLVVSQSPELLKKYKPYNFSQMIRIPEQTNKFMADSQNSWYIVTGGINFKLTDITSECHLVNTKFNIAQKISPLNKPRYTHSCVVHNGWAYVCGGRYFGQDDTAIMNHCEKFNISNYMPLAHRKQNKKDHEQKWISISPMNKPRCTFFMAVHQNKLWAIGGYTGQLERSQQIQFYDVSKQNSKWQILSFRLPFGIQSVIPLASNQNQVTIFGGNSDSGPMDTVLTLNLHQKTIKASKKLKQKRLLHKSSFSRQQNSLYIFGGNQKLNIQVYKLNEPIFDYQQDTEQSTVVDIKLKKHYQSQQKFQALTFSQSSMELSYSAQKSLAIQPSSKSDEIVYILGTSYEPFILELNISVPYTLYHPIPLSIKMHANQGGVYLDSGVFMIIGGISDTMDHVSSKVYIYDPQNRKGQQVESMLLPRYAFGYEKTQNHIYVVGGGSADQNGELIILNKCERIKISEKMQLNKWQKISDLPVDGLISPMTLNHQNRVYVFGGMKVNKQRFQNILKYDQKSDIWSQLAFKFTFGLQASSVYKKSDNQYLLFGGRVVNGDTKGIWALTMIQNGQNCVFVEKGQMTQQKSLHKIYKPHKQNFVVVFGGEKEPLSYYDCQTLKPIESDILIGMKQIFIRSLSSLQDKSLKNYLILNKN